MPPIPPLPFDDAVAAVYEATLRALADELLAAHRADDDRAATTVRDWNGFSRKWFDHHRHEVTNQLDVAAVRSATAASAVAAARAAARAAADRYALELAAEQAANQGAQP